MKMKMKWGGQFYNKHLKQDWTNQRELAGHLAYVFESERGFFRIYFCLQSKTTQAYCI